MERLFSSLMSVGHWEAAGFRGEAGKLVRRGSRENPFRGKRERVAYTQATNEESRIVL